MSAARMRVVLARQAPRSSMTIPSGEAVTRLPPRLARATALTTPMRGRTTRINVATAKKTICTVSGVRVLWKNSRSPGAR